MSYLNNAVYLCLQWQSSHCHLLVFRGSRLFPTTWPSTLRRTSSTTEKRWSSFPRKRGNLRFAFGRSSLGRNCRFVDEQRRSKRFSYRRVFVTEIEGGFQLRHPPWCMCLIHAPDVVCGETPGEPLPLCPSSARQAPGFAEAVLIPPVFYALLLLMFCSIRVTVSDLGINIRKLYVVNNFIRFDDIRQSIFKYWRSAAGRLWLPLWKRHYEAARKNRTKGDSTRGRKLALFLPQLKAITHRGLTKEAWHGGGATRLECGWSGHWRRTAQGRWKTEETRWTNLWIFPGLDFTDLMSRAGLHSRPARKRVNSGCVMLIDSPPCLWSSRADPARPARARCP